MAVTSFGSADAKHSSDSGSGAADNAHDGAPEGGYQGMDIWRDYIVSCQNTGIATIYRYDGKVMTREGEPFRLASYDVHNHSNVASFGRSFYDRHDKLPVLYVSQAYKEPVNGKKDLLYVERINPEKQTSELVQTICFDDVSHLFGYALQWVVDNDHHFLYGYGNTISNSDPKNRHRLVKFHIPPVKESPLRHTHREGPLRELSSGGYVQGTFQPDRSGAVYQPRTLVYARGTGQGGLSVAPIRLESEEKAHG
jgi:hypothetical protein